MWISQFLESHTHFFIKTRGVPFQKFVREMYIPQQVINAVHVVPTTGK